MTTLQKTIIGITLAVAVGTGVYEARKNARLRDQVQRLQQEQASLTAQVQQLIRERGELSRRVAKSEANAMKRVHEELAVKGKPSLPEIEAKIREYSRAGYCYLDRDRRRRDAEWQEFADLIDAADIAQTLAILDRVGSKDVRREFRRVLLVKWAESDPKAAADFASAMPAGGERYMLVGYIAEEWAISDLDGAIAWATQLLDKRDRARALGSIVRQWAQTEPEGALAFAQSLPAGHSQSQVFESVGRVLGLMNPAKAIEFANRLPDGSAHDAFIVSLAQGMAENSPREAAIFVSNLPAGEAQRFAAVCVAQRWVSIDPQSAAAWVSTFPAGKFRDRAAGNLMLVWAHEDPKAAGEWLAKFPVEQSQSAIWDYILEVDYSHPELAAPFVEKIIDPKQRNSTIEDLARQWLITDRAAAEAWLAKTSLPDDRKQQLLKNPYYRN